MHPRDIRPEIVRHRRTPCPKPTSAAGTVRPEQQLLLLSPAPNVQSLVADCGRYTHRASRKILAGARGVTVAEARKGAEGQSRRIDTRRLCAGWAARRGAGISPA